jgi:hypothetical protein
MLAAWVVSIAAWLPRWQAQGYVTIGLLFATLVAGGVLAAAIQWLPARRPNPS